MSTTTEISFELAAALTYARVMHALADDGPDALTDNRVVPVLADDGPDAVLPVARPAALYRLV